MSTKSCSVCREYRTTHRRSRKSPLLSHLDVELTERCNNTCAHCYINRPEDDLQAINQEVSAGRWNEILQEAADLGCLTVRFTGGEPLLREDFEEIYLNARRQGLTVALSTNATRVTDRLASLLSRIPPLEPVQVCVYGRQRRTYESVSRRPGSFQQAVGGLRRLLDRGVRCDIRMIELPIGSDCEEEQQTDVWPDSIAFQESVLYLYGRARRDDPEKNRAIFNLRIPPMEAADFFCRQPEEVAAMKRLLKGTLRPAGRSLFDCGAGIESGCIDAYGRYQLCLLLRHPDTVFDLRRGSLRSALEEFVPRIRAQEAKNQEYLSRCSRCMLQALCEQCPAKSWMEHGCLDQPVHYLCQVTHRVAECLGTLSPGCRGWQMQ